MDLGGAIDLESGGSTSEEEGTICTVPDRVCSGSARFDASIRGGGDSVSPSINNVPVETNVEQSVKDKRKTTSSKKPPRPPRGPSLDAADQKLIREISQLAMLKRARIERMKALKKMKEAKAASASSNVYATVITILFCLVILFQGMFTRGSSHVSFRGSPEPAVATSGGSIVAQYYKNLSDSEVQVPGSLPPNFIDEVSRSSS